MQRATTIALWSQSILAACFITWVSMLGKQGGLMVVALFFYYIPVAFLIALFGVWVAWRHPALRQSGLAIMLLPVAALFLPAILNSILGGPLLVQHLLAVLVLLAVAALFVSLFSPRRAVTVIPDALFRSRLWNGLIIFAIVAGWAFLVIVVVWALDDSNYRRDTGMGLAYAIVFAALYVSAMGLASAVAATWAWLGLRGGVDNACRKLNIAQLVVALPGILVGGTVFAWFLGQG